MASGIYASGDVAHVVEGLLVGADGGDAGADRGVLDGSGDLDVLGEGGIEEAGDLALVDRRSRPARSRPRLPAGWGLMAGGGLQLGGSVGAGFGQLDQRVQRVGVAVAFSEWVEPEQALDGGEQGGVVVGAVIDQVLGDQRRDDQCGNSRAELVEGEPVVVFDAVGLGVSGRGRGRGATWS